MRRVQSWLLLTITTSLLVHFDFLWADLAADSVGVKNEASINSNAHAKQSALPAIGFGTAGLQSDTAHATLMALRSGCRMIDTAQAAEWYDEAAVGEALRLYKYESSNENHIYIVTKIHPRSFELEKMKSMLSESRRKLLKDSGLNEEPLDVVLLHAPWCWRGHCTEEEEHIHWHTGWHNLEQLQDDFGILKIGVSNFGFELLQQLVLSIANRRVGVIQNWMDPFHQDREVRQFARAHGIEYQAYSSLGTQWGNSRRMRGQPNPVLNNDLLKQIAAKHQTTVARVVIAWINIEGAIALPRTRSPNHIQDNFGFLLNTSAIAEYEERGTIESAMIRQLVPLDESDLAAIRSLDGTLGNPWD